MATPSIHMATDMPRPSVRLRNRSEYCYITLDTVDRCCLIIPYLSHRSISSTTDRHILLTSSPTRQRPIDTYHLRNTTIPNPTLFIATATTATSIVHYLTLPYLALPTLPSGPQRRLTYFASTCPLLARSRSLPRARCPALPAPPAGAPSVVPR
jgi:hypothetical protein